jgi:hypothetical protein
MCWDWNEGFVEERSDKVSIVLRLATSLNNVTNHFFRRLTTIYNYPTIDDVTKRQLMDMFASSLDFTSNSRQPTPQQGDHILPISNEDNVMTEITDINSETKASSRATTPAAPEGEDQELDEYLYGTDTMIVENQVVLDTTVGDQIMTDANSLSAINDSPHIESDRDNMETPDAHTPGIQTPDPSRKSEEMDTASTHDLSIDKISDAEEEDESDDDTDGHEQNQQSFWMFADLLPRFQDASKTIKTARLNNDIDEVQAHSYICKKNLREILNIYLKMVSRNRIVTKLKLYIICLNFNLFNA